MNDKEPPVSNHAAYRLPAQLAAGLILTVLLSQVIEARRHVFSYPKGPAAHFYQGVLIIGVFWVVACGLLLALNIAQDWLEARRLRRERLWDSDLDARAGTGEWLIVDDDPHGPHLWDREQDGPA